VLTYSAVSCSRCLPLPASGLPPLARKAAVRLSPICGRHALSYAAYMNEYDDNDRYEPLDPDQEWDEELADDLIGATLFIGITHVDNAGHLVGREQVFGTVEGVSKRAGIKLLQTDGEPYIIAPVLDAIEAGEIGSYRFTEDGEVVESPDFVAWITATRPPLN